MKARAILAGRGSMMRSPAPAKWPADYRSAVDRQGQSPPFPLVLRVRLGRIDQRRGQIHLRHEQCTLIERRLQVKFLCRPTDEQREFPDRLGLIPSHLPVVAHLICSAVYSSISPSIDWIKSLIASFGSAASAMDSAATASPLVARPLSDVGRLCVDISSPHESRSPARQCSLRLNARRLDHLAPLFGIFDNEFAELGR
jgi:hypothetical protein